MKTPEEIKSGLAECSAPDDGKAHCSMCSYYADGNGAVCIRAMTGEALSYIKQLEAQVPKWVSVLNEIPVTEDDVLVLIGSKDVEVGWFNGYDGRWRTYGCVAGDVTHWMPLPEEPKEGKE